MNKKLIAGILIAASACWALQWNDGNDSRNEAAERETIAVSERLPAPVKTIVYITGAVQKPGVYALAQNSRVFDAVNAAGGCLPYADEQSVNLAEAAVDGQHIHIPYQLAGEERRQEESGKVSLNQADLEELKTLPGIGKATAEKIIEYREEKGAFESIDDLMKVKGIGKNKFEKIKEKLSL